MGGTWSKAARRLPRRAEPSWAGARIPRPPATEQAADLLLASETKHEGIERDAIDPQYMAKLNQVGPVEVDHHMTTNQNRSAVHMSRLQEEQASSMNPLSTRNRLNTSTLFELMNKRKKALSVEDIKQIAQPYDFDADRLQQLAKFINTPSIEPGSAVRVKDAREGTESIIANAQWYEPSLSPLSRSPHSRS